MLSKSFGSLRHMRRAASVATPRFNFRFFGVLTPGKPRQEKDTFGPIEVPGDKYWGAQTQRSV